MAVPKKRVSGSKRKARSLRASPRPLTRCLRHHVEVSYGVL
ncbi:hypothetical protein HCDSEM_134 [Candidatus Hodgkinia cicadicola Dsem]|nr:hypothetical protein HCDSEM_134 [Candidatus Hodgkinia cicadicola Dsem]